MRKFFTLSAIAIALGLAGLAPRAAGQGSEVFVVYSTRVPDSRDIAAHYAAARQVPPEQVLGLDLPDRDTISREEFSEKLDGPLLAALARRNLIELAAAASPASSNQPPRIAKRIVRSSIRYLVLCYGVPLRIAEDPDLHPGGDRRFGEGLRRNGAAVDSELAALPLRLQGATLIGPLINPAYQATNVERLAPVAGLLMVARLDGPSAAVARALVDKAMQAESNGLWGRAYFDLRGITNGAYAIADASLGEASEICRDSGIETVVDHNPATFPAGYPLSQVAFYAGWYQPDVCGPFAQPVVEFMPGAIAYHLHSFSAATLRTATRHWAGPLLAKGATATMGCVDEPYVELTPNMGVFFDRLVRGGWSFGEAAYSSQLGVSWQTTVIGDPLYRPFAVAAQPRHDELESRGSKWLEWSDLQLMNLRLSQGAPVTDVISAIENLPEAKRSAVLTEKLADLYASAGEAASSVSNLQEALRLDVSPQQGVRIMLELADKLAALHRDEEARAVCRQFMEKYPDYPDTAAVIKRLHDLDLKSTGKADAARAQSQTNRLSMSDRPFHLR